MSVDKTKIEQEEWEAGFLFKHLGVETYQKCECPDFTFDYEGKHIGLEHTKWFPNGKTIDNNKWREIERMIQNELDKSGMTPRFICYTAKTHIEGGKNYKAIAEEIINGYRFMLENNMYRLDESNYDGFKLDRLSYISFFPDMTLKQFALSEMLGGVVSENDLTKLTDTIRKKEKKLMEYRKDPKNNDIQEYWLSVYIPLQEFCIAEGDRTPFNNSSYDRIYLANGRDRVRTNGDTSSIIRLK